MGRVVYEVPLVTQAANPICWVACMAMIASERQGMSVGVAMYADGFDPSNSSIPNPANGSWDTLRRQMERAGFSSAALNADAGEIERLLQTKGPFILNHYCAGFPYGAGWGAVTTPNATHAVVITGYDSGVNGGMCWMNNPWGNKDRPILASAVISSIVSWLPTGQFQVNYWD